MRTNREKCERNLWCTKRLTKPENFRHYKTTTHAAINGIINIIHKHMQRELQIFRQTLHKQGTGEVASVAYEIITNALQATCNWAHTKSNWENRKLTTMNAAWQMWLHTYEKQPVANAHVDLLCRFRFVFPNVVVVFPMLCLHSLAIALGNVCIQYGSYSAFNCIRCSHISWTNTEYDIHHTHTWPGSSYIKMRSLDEVCVLIDR